jgi:simple sugar transport system permease protein
MFTEGIVAVARPWIFALVAFGIVIALAGKHPLDAYMDAARHVFGSVQGFSELFVRAGPLVLGALAVSIPARVGLFNVGGEGQIYLGAIFATAVALALPDLSAWLLFPLTMAAGIVGGALWAALPAVLRVRGLGSEAITTLLLNYVAPLIVGYLIFGPWRSPESASYPQSPMLADAARMATLPGTRLHAGLAIALALVALDAYVVRRTRFGLDMRAIGGNAAAARQLGLPVSRYLVACMAIGGGCAGLIGMVEVSAIQGRLVSEISPGYGYAGFLVAWLAGNSSVAILAMALLFSLVGLVGDVMQVTQGLPYAAINILMATVLFVVLCGGGRRGARA